MLRVMIADDEPYVREGLEKLIPWEELGCRLIYSAENGRDLLEKMDEELPDLVIVDIRMPLVDGLEVAEYIFRNRLKTAVIILTAYADFHYAHKAIQYKVSDYIVKTSALEEIPAAIQRLQQRYESEEMVCYRMVLMRMDKNMDRLRQFYQYAFSAFDYRPMNGLSEEEGLILSLKGSSNSEDVILGCEKLRNLCRNFLGEEPRIICSRIYGQWGDQREIYKELTEYAEERREGIILQPQFADSSLESDNVLDDIRKYIHRHYTEKVTLLEVAEAVHFSPGYLSRFYKMKTGENLFDTINSLRIEKARRLLEKGDKKIYEIADLTGFEDTAYFSKVFKKYTGCPPKEYARMEKMKK